MRPPRNGFTPSLHSAEHGFTLVELLVALSIFALVSLMSVALLRSSIDTQNAVGERLAEGGGIERLRALLASELLVAQPATGRDPSGGATPAFAGSATAISFASIADGSDGAPPLRRLRLEQSGAQLTLTRDTSAPAPIIGDLASARFRFRGSDGGWSDNWSPPRPDALPRAVELTLTPRDRPPLIMRFVVAPGPDGPNAPEGPA
jgi:general secretion pathway protein J